MNKLGRHDLEDTPDACIVSYQFSKTTFSIFGGVTGVGVGPLGV